MVSPQLSKGAVIALDSSSSQPICSITFQYNPETIVRTLSPNWKEDNPLHMVSTPEETINISIELDATNKLEMGDPIIAESGIYPELSALETLVYPKSRSITENANALADGKIELAAYEAPLVLFNWGLKHIPVQITGLTITEQEYDAKLNPLRAIVSLSMHVLDYRAFPMDHKGFEYFKAYHRSKEQMASRYKE